MQLKKHLTVARNVVTVSAVAAMLAVSMPAFASTGMNLGGASHVSLTTNAKGARKDREPDSKEDLKMRWDKKQATGSASATPTCRSVAAHAHADAIKSATTERDTELKAAHDALQAALKAARAQYHADISASSSLTVSATGTPWQAGDWKAWFTMSTHAHKAYAAAVKAAHKAYADAKHAILANYRTAVGPADAAYRAARLACRPATGSASGTAQ